MDFTLERLVRTSSSEKYRLFRNWQAYAEITIHYVDVIQVDMLFLTRAEEVKDLLESLVISMPLSHIEGIQYNVYMVAG